LPDDPTIGDRVRAADEYWRLWEDESFWGTYRDRLLGTLESSLGPHSKYYATDGGKWPPRALVRFDLSQAYVLVTLGMSLLPMPQVEMETDNPGPYRRAELGAVVDRRVPEAEVTKLASYLSGQMRYPWHAWTYLGHGHTISCHAVPASCGGARLPFVLLSTAMPGAPQIKWPPFRGDPINLLWITPITAQERELAIRQGSDAVRAHLAQAGRTALIAVGS
jgi:hypothetical protein